VTILLVLLASMLSIIFLAVTVTADTMKTVRIDADPLQKLTDEDLAMAELCRRVGKKTEEDKGTGNYLFFAAAAGIMWLMAFMSAWTN